MRATKFAFLVFSFMLAVFFVGGLAVAAESGAKADKKSSGKTAEKTAAKSNEAGDEESAVKPAEKPAAKPAQPAAKKPAAAEKAEAPKDEEQQLTPLEQRLKDLQAALERATQVGQRKIPKDIKELAKYLPNKEKDLNNPETNKPMGVNESMLGKMDGAIEKPKQFITFYADQPTPNKGRAAIFADGTIKYLSEEDFKKALEASKPKELSRDDVIDLRERRQSRGK